MIELNLYFLLLNNNMLLIITTFRAKSDSLIIMVICKKSFYSQTAPSVVYKFALCLQVCVQMWICTMCLCSMKRGNISIKIPEKVLIIPANYVPPRAILVPAMPIIFMTSSYHIETPFLRWKKYMNTSIELILTFAQTLAVCKAMTKFIAFFNPHRYHCFHFTDEETEV